MTKKPTVLKRRHRDPLTGPTIFSTPWQYGTNHTADRLVLGIMTVSMTERGNIKTVVD